MQTFISRSLTPFLIIGLLFSGFFTAIPTVIAQDQVESVQNEQPVTVYMLGRDDCGFCKKTA